MTDPLPSEVDADDPVLGAVVELIRTAGRPEVLEAQRILLQRLVTAGDVLPSRIPPPKNITELGGYLNLLEGGGEQAMRMQAIASALGIAGPTLTLAGGLTDSVVDITNVRPEGPAQPSIPVSFPIRADLHAPLVAALDSIRTQGAGLPLRARRPALPPRDAPDTVSLDVLGTLGRTLEVVPGTALVSPSTDPVALARPDDGAGESLQLVVRALSGTTTLPEASWIAVACSATACAELAPQPARFLPVAPIMAAAGWYHESPGVPPTSLSTRGTMLAFRNLTGLFSGETKLGDELALLFTATEIARSALATHLGAVWNGTTFANP